MVPLIRRSVPDLRSIIRSFIMTFLDLHENKSDLYFALGYVLFLSGWLIRLRYPAVDFHAT